jgi:undecaprenyl-diphosphatase
MRFPGGHGSISAVVLLTIGALFASKRHRTLERMLIVSTATLITLLVGLSRVALGVHWATDVVGGWAFGTGWALAWLLLARHLKHRPAAGGRTEETDLRRLRP